MVCDVCLSSSSYDQFCKTRKKYKMDRGPTLAEFQMLSLCSLAADWKVLRKTNLPREHLDCLLCKNDKKL